METTPQKVPLVRPNWTDYYLGLAFVVSRRSHDMRTKHGCVIVDKNYRPLGFGYNGFPRGVNDNRLPNFGSDKYAWMVHSEKNAIANCNKKIKSGTAYVTGRCCNSCLEALVVNGVVRIFMADTHGSFLLTDKDFEWQKEYIRETGIEVNIVKPNLSWLNDLLKTLEEKYLFHFQHCEAGV
jgi:dCMP deaminase